MSLSKPKLPILQRGHPLARGLTGAWLAHEGSGTTIHGASPYRRGGTIRASVAWARGRYGYVYDFPNSSHQGISLGTPNYITAEAYSLVTLFMYPSAASNDFRHLCSNDNGSSIRVWQWRIESGNRLNFIRFSSTGSVVSNFNGVMSVKDGLWHIGVAVFGAAIGGSRIYLDGKLENSDAATNGNRTLATNDVTMGVRQTTTERMYGQIALQLIYNRALTPAEVRALHIDPYQAFCPTRRYWPVLFPVEDTVEEPEPPVVHDPRSGFRRRIIVT